MNRQYYGYRVNIYGTHEGAEELAGLEEVARFIASDFSDKIITDEMDQFICDTFGMFINQCPDKRFLEELLRLLIPLQS